MDYKKERELNIIKNIATEIVMECSQEGVEVTQELANYMVKLKLLNPKNGFTASEVMPRNLTQQLVLSVVEDLKQNTPAMNCIRMQVYWNTVKMNIAELKKEYVTIMTDRGESYLNEIASLDKDDLNKISKLVAVYSLVVYNLGNMTQAMHLREVAAAVHSLFKSKEILSFSMLLEEEKMEKVKVLAKKVAGIRQYLKFIGKASEGTEDVQPSNDHYRLNALSEAHSKMALRLSFQVRDLLHQTEAFKDEMSKYAQKMTTKINDIRYVLSNLITMNLFDENLLRPGELDLPPDVDANELTYLKKILVIMLQHNFYLNDIISKLEEIDGTVNFFCEKYMNTLQKLHDTIRDREAVPTTEVYDDFETLGELWQEIQSYFYCLEIVSEIAKSLETFNKKSYFVQTPLEKAYGPSSDLKESTVVAKPVDSNTPFERFSSMILEDQEDFQIEFNGYCAWTLYYTDGVLVPGNPKAGIFQHEGLYYAFADSRLQDMWAREPQYFLTEVYETLRENPEMVELLNAYESLYNAKDLQTTRKTDRKVLTRTETVQTVLHPVEEHWDKDYTFSVWELRKRALALSRLVKCVTKSVQTTSPHSHYRSSIGLLAAPDKDKEVQTKRDSSCAHSVVANYLYGLRGHREDKFRVVELTRPVDESFERKIELENEDPCRDRRRKRVMALFDECPAAMSDIDGVCDDDIDPCFQNNGEFDDV